MTKIANYKNPEPNGKNIPEMMSAWILAGKGFENLAFKQVPVPEPNANQFLARVDAVLGCASDVKVVESGGEHPLFYGWNLARWPVSIGHEGCLTAVKIGKNLTGKIKVGDTFAVQPAIKCGPMHHRERYRNNATGIERIAIGYSIGGLFAEYYLVTEEIIQTGSIIPFDAGRIPYFSAAILEPFSCVYAAQQHSFHLLKSDLHSSREIRMGLRETGITLILGAGPLGIMHAELAMAYRPRMMIISEPIAARRNQAFQLLNARANENNIELFITNPVDLPALVREKTAGRGVDDCIVALGDGKVQEEVVQYLAPYGVANFFGGTRPHDSLITVDARRIHYNNVTMVGSSGGDPSDVAAVMKMIEAGRISPNHYVKQVGGLDQVQTLLHGIKNREFWGKGLIYPHTRGIMKPVDAWSREDENSYLNRNLE